MTDDRALTRRRLLQLAGGTAVAVGLAGCGSGDRTASPEVRVSTDVDAVAWPPLPPGTPPQCNVHRFFTTAEAAVVDALVARIIPGDARDPGAREACVPAYIDDKLARFPSFATPTYFQPPFAKPVTTGPVPPDQRDAETILVDAADAHLYGFQADLTPQESWRKGIAALQAYCRRRHGRPFEHMAPARQDALLDRFQALKDASDHGAPVPTAHADLDAAFAGPSASGFFGMVLEDTYEGMFADPAYGGNKGMAGWLLIGYPGAQRAYTPDEVLTPGTDRPPQSLGQMPHMHPGMPEGDAMLPMAGTLRTGTRR
ncbi:MAG: gluconate 2-dehydrogenase subunit 3 family protein [Thermoleophilia bacterium]|nr:gluconate 2-dehydrogenase subunit 3 family protein [Thermoleophilia bacterium]